MRSWRENPDGPENTEATKQNEREVFALKRSKEICPFCHGRGIREVEAIAMRGSDTKAFWSCPNCKGAGHRPVQY